MTSQRPLVVVDLSAGPCRETAEALLSAAEHEGFFFLVGHGIPQQEVDAAFALSRRFFAAPDDVKRATRGDTSNAHYVLGYTEELLAEGTTARQGFLCGAFCAPRAHRHTKTVS
jgi:isopenicillin N synthase-like dioxygenase